MPILSLTASYVYEGNTLNLNLLWLFTKLQLLTAELGVAAMLYGAMADDTGDHRPGHRTAVEFAVR